jgi:hypothetical protein
LTIRPVQRHATSRRIAKTIDTWWVECVAVIFPVGSNRGDIQKGLRRRYRVNSNNDSWHLFVLTFLGKAAVVQTQGRRVKKRLFSILPGRIRLRRGEQSEVTGRH